MARFDPHQHPFTGPAGQLPVPPDDEVPRKLAMRIEGEGQGLGPLQAARKFGFSKQRYFPLRTAFLQTAALALHSRPRGPKRNYRRTDEGVRQVIRHRFLDPEASPALIAQKLTQAGWPVRIRSVERVIEQFGLQKKSPSLSSGHGLPRAGDATHHHTLQSRTLRSALKTSRSAGMPRNSSMPTKLWAGIAPGRSISLFAMVP